MKIDYKTVGTWIGIVVLIVVAFWIGGIRTQNMM